MNTKQLAEATDPTSSSAQRIRELYLADPDCRGALAANPSCPWDLLNELAQSFPREALSNPLMQLFAGMDIAEQLSQLSLKAALALVVATGENVPNYLVEILRRHLLQAVEEISSTWFRVAKTETWAYERSVEAGAPFEITIDVSIEVDLKGEDTFCLPARYSRLAEESDYSALAKLLQCFCHASVEGLLDDCDEDSGEMTEVADIIVDEEIETRIEISSFSDGVDIEGDSVLLAGTQRELFRVNAFFVHSEDEDPAEMQDGVLSVPVCDHTDSSGDLPALQEEAQLGQFERLWGWSPTTFGPGVCAENWTEWIALLLSQSPSTK